MQLHTSMIASRAERALWRASWRCWPLVSLDSSLYACSGQMLTRPNTSTFPRLVRAVGSGTPSAGVGDCSRQRRCRRISSPCYPTSGLSPVPTCPVPVPTRLAHGKIYMGHVANDLEHMGTCTYLQVDFARCQFANDGGQFAHKLLERLSSPLLLVGATFKGGEHRHYAALNRY